MLVSILGIALLAFVEAFAVFLGKKKYNNLANPIIIYSTVWLIPTIFSLTGLYGLYITSVDTIVIIIINVIFFCFSCFFVNGQNLSRYLSECSDDRMISKNQLSIIVGLNLLANIWASQFVIKMLPSIVAGDWALARSYYLLAAINHTVYTVLTSLTLQWIVQPIFYATAIISACLLAKGKPNYLLIIISVVDTLCIVIATAGRSVVFRVIVFYMMAYLLINVEHSKLRKRIHDLPMFVKILFVCAIAGLVFITSQRKMSGNSTILQNVYVYFVGPIPYLDNIIKNPDNYALYDNLLLGRATFGFITNPIEIIASRLFNFDYRGVDNIITTYVSQYVYISPTLRANAFSTSIYPFMMDFGVLGIIIGPVIYGQIVSRIYKRSRKVRKRRTLFWDGLLVLIMYTVVFSEWEYALIFPSMAVTAFFLFIMTSHLRIALS